MAVTNIVDSVKNGIIGTIKGTGEILNAVTDTISDVLGNTLTSTGKVGSAATGAVSEVARGVIQGTTQVGGSSQWLHRRGRLTMAGAAPPGLSISYCSTVVRNWPIGGRFSTEQLTVQA